MPWQVPGLVNVDFADVRTIIAGAGSSLMGQGRASGKERARDAALAAISSPLLDVGIERATGIVWNITGPPDLTLFEVRHTMTHRLACATRGRLSGGDAWQYMLNSMAHLLFRSNLCLPMDFVPCLCSIMQLQQVRSFDMGQDPS